MARRIFLLVWIVLAAVPAAAQSGQNGGQFCLRSFEDRNGDGQYQTNEPLLTKGVAVDLLNAQGIVIASALLDNSPTATQGVICFQYLAPGQYSLSVSSPDLSPTTPQAITATISDGQRPTLVDFGGQRIAAVSSSSVSADAAVSLDDQRTQLIRLGVSAGGAVVVVLGMMVVGFLIYWLGYRGRLTAAQAEDLRRTTGSMRQVRSTDTGEIRYP